MIHKFPAVAFRSEPARGARVLVTRLTVAALAITLLAGCGIRRKKYETPIASDSQQPDKTLFDKAVNDIEKSRYEVARLTLQTLINTYPDSEYLAKSKLAIADAWYRQGGTSSLAQAEAEYKDFITFFPTMPEASEAQHKVAMIHYSQMEKPDRDRTHARRAEDEFKQLLLQFPDSPFKEEAEQRLREVQEVLADGEFRVGRQYFIKQNPRAAISRLKEVTEDYPNFSAADQALFMLGESYELAGSDFRLQASSAYSRIVSDYPLSDLVEDAKEKLTAWKMEVPAAKPEAYARMKYDMEHRPRRGMVSRSTDIFRKRPDVSMASLAGKPVLTTRTAPTPEPEPGVTDGGGTVKIQLEPVAPATTAPPAPGQPPAAQGGATGTVAQRAQAAAEAAAAAPDAAPAAPAPPQPSGADAALKANPELRLPNRAQDEPKATKRKSTLRKILRLPGKKQK